MGTSETSVKLESQWVSFWIKPEAAPARVTLGVTSLLTLSTQHAKSQASLPPVSYIKAVDAFMSVCTVFVFLALMEYCLVNIVLGDNDGPKMPEIPNQAANIRNMSVKESKELRNLGVPPPPPRPSINLANRNRMRAIRIDKFSRIFFPVLFTALNLSYWYLFAEHL
uniref:Neur_chan_memb domain-containing protein n=1 Tax=Rhodnius prolixus TaxID=13249 RepID=T1IBP2_RHOPR